jgi:hypothetical protein
MDFENSARKDAPVKNNLPTKRFPGVLQVIDIYVPRRRRSNRLLNMNMFRSIPTPLRFVVWLFLTLPVMFGANALGYFLPASAIKFDLIIALEIACNLLLGWLFGLVRFQNRLEIGTSILVIIFALSMPAILIVLAIVSTLFCGIDACGR